MKYKMLVLDLDDTLLRDDLSISKETKDAILLAQSYGTKVVIATGRPTYACHSIAKEIGLDRYGGYIISFNGAVITEVNTGNVLQDVSISKEEVHNLYKLSNEHNAYIQTYIGDDIVTPQNNQYTEIEKKLTGMNILEVEDFVDYVNTSVTKAIILQEPTYLKELALKIKPVIANTLNMTFSKPFFLEFMNRNVDKAVSVTYLANYLGIQMESVIAIGDGYNDISMIEKAGLGVAMGNGVDAIKNTADYVTKCNMKDGIVEVVYKYLLVENVISNHNSYETIKTI